MRLLFVLILVVVVLLLLVVTEVKQSPKIVWTLDWSLINSRPVAYFLLVDFGGRLGSRGYPRVPVVFLGFPRFSV